MELHFEKLKESKAVSFPFEERINRVLFFAGFTLYLLWKFHSITVMSLPEGSRIHTVVHLLVWVLLAVPLIKAVLTKETRFSTIVLLGAGLIIKVTTSDIEMIDLAILLSAGHRVDFRDICKHALKVMLPLLVLTVLLALLGVISNYPFMRGSTIRYGLGFSYSVFPSMLFMYLTMVYLYVYDLKPPVISYPIILLINIGLYVMTDTRSPFLLVFSLCGISIAYRFAKTNQWLVRLSKLVKFLPCLIMLISIAVAVAYNSQSDVWQKLNKVTSNRLIQTQSALNDYGVKPFGQYINLRGNALGLGDSDGSSLYEDEDADKNFIDSSFMSCLIRKGWVTAALLVLVLTVAASGAYKNGNYAACLILAVIFASTAFDIQLLQVLYNTFLFYIWQSFIREGGLRNRNCS